MNLLPFNVLEDVALIISRGDLEGQRCVVALQHSRVIVEDGQLAPCIAQEAVGASWVVHVVHCCRDQRSHFVNGIQTLLLVQTDCQKNCGNATIITTIF